MVALDDVEKWIRIINERAAQSLSDREYAAFQEFSAAEVHAILEELFQRPMSRFTPISEAYFRAKWVDALRVSIGREDFSLLEIATGDADIIPQAMDRAFPKSRYCSVNMNRALSRSFVAKTRNLRIRTRLIEDDGQNIERHLGGHSVNVIAFQHGLNDVLQTILCQREGIDTVDSDWMETLPMMIEILKREVAHNTFEGSVKGTFLAIVRSLLSVLADDGVILMHHYLFQLDLDWGYPASLFENLIGIVRGWIAEVAELREMKHPGFSPAWWLFYRKVA